MRLLLFAMLACTDPATPGDTGAKGGTDDAVDVDGDGFSEAEGDCDDEDANVFPGAPETCDGYDQDCDGEADAALMSTWYLDADGDGYGGTSVHVGCEPSENEIALGGDCDDNNADVSPRATEVCDGRDNDCDGETDEGVVSTWYADADGDGFGNPRASEESCVADLDQVADNTDCDDRDAAVFPGATEWCNGEDDDCDGTTDEADAEDASTWYYDDDGDGFGGSGITVTACDEPAGYHAGAEDCDDADAAVFPGATEWCNGEDDDCDGTTDEDDAEDAFTWYYDYDGDGFGGSRITVTACDAPPDYKAAADDCDDGDDDVFPGATELCNGEDDDCDGSLLAGESGDTDGDGLYDCDDGDIDGDGLRNDWDADAYDSGVARGPTGGLGGDGAYTASGTETWGDWTLLDGAGTAGSGALSVDDGSIFAEGDEVLVLSQQGSDAGTYAFAFVSGVSRDDLSVEPPLSASFSASSVVLVVRVPHFTDLAVPTGAAVYADPWAGSGGGVIVARASGAVSVAGTVSADGAGFGGGVGVSGCCSTYPTAGESHGGVGTYSSSANGGGGGTYAITVDGGECGGGGGYGSAGSDGTDSGGSALGNAGSTYGAASLATWFLGSGGGAGSPDNDSDGQDAGNVTGDGGAGGGLLLFFAGSSLSVSGSVTARGDDGQDADASGDGEVGGGGGGSGGTVLLAAPTVAITGTVVATGGAGGTSAWPDGAPYGSAYGGDGGDGRVRVDSDSSSGSTLPSAYAGSFDP